MTGKTKLIIEGIHNGRFGVEVEMYNITREKAAKTAATFFGTGRYENTAHIHGYHSWSAWDQEGREWLFSRDISIKARNEQEQCELVTPLLRYNDMELLQELIRQLRHAKALSTPDHFCGIHLHLHEEGHTPQSLRTFANLMASYEDLIAKAVGLDKDREIRYCRTVDPDFLRRLNRKKPKTMQELADCWYNGSSGREGHYHPSRYTMCNYHSLFKGTGIELRLFQFDNPNEKRRGGLNAGQLKSMIQLGLGLSELAKNSKYASPKKRQRENECFALRTFMIRLGFIGEEFKTARSYFMRNLNGSSAWRYKA